MINLLLVIEDPPLTGVILMAAKIVNLADPDEAETSCASVQEAEQTLSALVQRFKSQGFRVEEKRDLDEEYPQYTVYDHSDVWIGTYTIISL